MIDLLTFATVYAILKVCEGVSINLLSSTVFESIKDKIFKKKGKSEKELLKDAIQELKKSNIGADIQEEITKKEDKILSVSLEYYSELSKDTAEIKRLSELLNEKIDEMKAEQIEISKKTAELIDLVSGFGLPRTYRIFERDLDGVRDALYIHPTIIEGYIERPETEELTAHQNVRILGTPGIGKTTAIYKIIERSNPELVVIITDAFTETDVNRLLREDLADNFLLVWDDFHVRPTLFMDTIYKLRNTIDNFYVLCAARSTEIEKINEEIPLEFWEKANLTEVIELQELERNQNIALIRLCCKEFTIEARDEVVRSLAAKNERSAGTPLYIVSVLIEFRDGQMKMGDIENLPGDAVTLWKEVYFPRLSADEKAVLYCLKLLKLVNTPAFKEIVSKMWKNIFEKGKADLFTAIESLKRKIWLKEAENAYSSFDVQLEAIEIGNEWFEDFETFVESNELEQNYQSLLLFNLSYYYSEKIKKSRTKAELSSNLEKAIKYIEEAIRIYKELGLKANVATSLNNASSFYSDLAGLEETKEARKEKLDIAVEYIEEAIGIRRELGLKAEVATSLNNASSFYSDLAELEETKEARKEKLDIAVEYIEEAIGIRRGLGLKADVATSLNNASSFYSDLAGLEETKEARKEKLDIAVEYIEEAIGIRRELGLKAEVATSLNNASSFYSDLAELEETKEARKEKLDIAVEYIEEAIGIRRGLGLKADVATSLNNASSFYSDLAGLEETKEARKEKLDIAVEYIEEAIGIRRELGLKAEVATSLNNASNRYSDLAGLEETKEARKEKLDIAVEYIEEAIGIYKELGLKADVATSLNNASSFYSDLAGLEETKEARKEKLDIAVEYIEEAIGIRRGLGLKANVATSLNNASNRYSDLAGLEETKEARKEKLDIAVEYIEEAIGIYKELGLKADVAMSLNNASNRYSGLAGLEETKEARKEKLDLAVHYIEEAIGIRRGLGLKAEVATSLNNASNHYSDLAELEETKEARKEKLDIAVEYIEEAIGIYKELGLKADVAMSLNNASNRYSGLAGLEETKEARKEKLDLAVHYIEEAIGIRRGLGLKAEVATSLNNASSFYSGLAGLEETKEARKEKLDIAVEYIEEAIGIYKELGLKADVAMSLNNASSFYSDLAGLEETKEARKEKLDLAVHYIEEAIGIRRGLGLKADVAMSLNNASSFYSGLAGLEETKEARKEKLDIAVEYIEEAIGIYKELGLKADVAMSLNNASNPYSDLAELEETKEARKEKLDLAVHYIEEAIGIRRGLGLKADVVMSLNNASNRYSDLAGSEETKEARKEKLDLAVHYIEEAIGIRRDLGLQADLANSLAISVFVFNDSIEFDGNYFMKAAGNCDEAIKIFLDFGMVDKAKLLIPYGIRFHETLYKIDSEERHKQKIEFYKSIGS